MERYSHINIRGEKESVKVKIGSAVKPKLKEEIAEKWQTLIDTAARLVDVPSALIMRLNEKTIEVFLRSNTENNPYEMGEEANLVYGLYCETVIGTQRKLLIPDASKDQLWNKNNPDVEMNMVSYLGFPINWPDGEVFGTVCLLDNKENNYNKDYEDLLRQIKQHMEDDLELLILYSDLQDKSKQILQSSSTKSKFLSLISHDVRGGLATIKEMISMIVNDFDRFDSAQLKQILSSLNQTVGTSYETLEDLLSWSKNDLIQLQPELTSFDIIEEIERLLSFFSQSIQLKGIKVTRSYGTEKVMVNTDQNMINVALRNILSNAIKYNHRDGEIEIIVRSQGQKNEILISDTGIGMDEEVTAGLFSYSQGHSKGTLGESSAGIGLILTREFLDKLEARISVQSTPGKGSTFGIIL